jgi:amidase
VEASISDLQRALATGCITSVELAARCLHRISKYDCQGPTLNAIPVLNPNVFEEAAASDDRRAKGLGIGPLDGIPYTVKDSYKVKGMTVASGSPAFENLIANEDAFTVQRLREAGAVLIGKTNMPPMAAGGMQRGVYGRAESPYNTEYLTAAFASGSSNGSATATAASFAAFGMGEETVSSGRSPASNNGLVAYTPSRGVISIRGNWPLFPTCDVVVPHTRSMEDLFTLLDVISVSDPITHGDFWRHQPFVQLPDSSTISPFSYHDLPSKTSLRGKRIAIPKMYINGDDPAANPIQTRESIVNLWYEARSDLEALGATIVETDFPLVTNYEKAYHALQNLNVEGIPDGWNAIERGPLIAYAWDDFLLSNSDANHPNLKEIDSSQIFPQDEDSLQIRLRPSSNAIDYDKLYEHISSPRPAITALPGLSEALNALEAARKRDLEDWMDANLLDLVVFPANGDVGRANADVDEEAAKHAWANGVKYSNGNRVLRHLGVPTVTVTMGIMEDIGMPVGLTFAGKAYSDLDILSAAWEFESVKARRVPPSRTPALESDVLKGQARSVAGKGDRAEIILEDKRVANVGGEIQLSFSGRVDGGSGAEVEILEAYVEGSLVQEIRVEDGKWSFKTQTAAKKNDEMFLTIAKCARDQIMVVLLCKTGSGRVSGRLIML